MGAEDGLHKAGKQGGIPKAIEPVLPNGNRVAPQVGRQYRSCSSFFGTLPIGPAVGLHDVVKIYDS
jgi:hypothetical protein